MDTFFTKNKDGIVLSKTEIKRNNKNQVILEKYYNKEDKLFQTNEYFYNPKGQLIKLIKSYPIKQKKTVFEYKYDTNNDYEEIIQTSTATVIEEKKIRNYAGGKFFMEVSNVYPRVEVNRVISEDIEKISCNNIVINNEGEHVNFTEYIKSIEKNSIYTTDYHLNNLLNGIVLATHLKEWRTVDKFASKLIEYIEEKTPQIDKLIKELHLAKIRQDLNEIERIGAKLQELAQSERSKITEQKKS